MGDDEQIALLAERLKARMAQNGARELLLMADKRVPHGDVMFFVNVAREAGARRVNVAEKPN
jgi:biopolymer transport protein ExbD